MESAPAAAGRTAAGRAGRPLWPFLLLVPWALSACGPSFDTLVKDSTAGGLRDAVTHPAVGIPRQAVPLYGYKVVKSWPHHSWAFTEGLVFQNGVLLESTGLYDQSSLLKVIPGSGQLIERRALSGEYFAEGVTVFRDRIYQLTLSGSGFIYNQNSLRQIGEFSFDGQGWGLTHDDTRLIMSNGSNVIQFMNPDSFKIERAIRVVCNDVPVNNLNALQYVKGEIYANVWKTDYIVRINPKSGEITGWIDLKGLLPPEERAADTDVLNGIAYDEGNDRLVVTGKRWPKYFEIRLEELRMARS
jgi:glutamine cyclotransferase